MYWRPRNGCHVRPHLEPAEVGRGTTSSTSLCLCFSLHLSLFCSPHTPKSLHRTLIFSWSLSLPLSLSGSSIQRYGHWNRLSSSWKLKMV